MAVTIQFPGPVRRNLTLEYGLTFQGALHIKDTIKNNMLTQTK